jgi:ribonuclease D
VKLITDSGELAEFCARLSAAEFVTVDTEFMRERTYWPRLCLVQLAGADEYAGIDPLAPGIELEPLLRLMNDGRVLKVFHAARQDLEIFFNLTGRVPAPLFDTQVAAMVCGFGESASYETLVAQLARAQIDKSMRFTDWAARPLTERQINYALADVTHLRTVYLALAKKLMANGRAQWLEEEMAVLLDPITYRTDPDEAWRRLRPRSARPKVLAVLREVAAWREREAQRRDIPRVRILRDEALLEIAVNAPTKAETLARTRGLSQGFAEGRLGQDLLEAVKRGLEMPEERIPQLPPSPVSPPGIGPIVELLKVLLKLKCEEHHVAPKLVASSADLDRVAASDDADVPALHGWRREIFGNDALSLKHGRIALSMRGKRIVMMRVGEDGDEPAPEAAQDAAS